MSNNNTNNSDIRPLSGSTKSSYPQGKKKTYDKSPFHSPFGKLPNGTKSTPPVKSGPISWKNDSRIDEYYAQQRKSLFLDHNGNRIIPDYNEVDVENSCDVEYNPYSSSKAGRQEYRPTLRELEPPAKRRGSVSPPDFYLGKTSDFIAKMSDKPECDELGVGLIKLKRSIENGKRMGRSTLQMEIEYCWHQWESDLRKSRVAYHNSIVPKLREQMRSLFGDKEELFG